MDEAERARVEAAARAELDALEQQTTAAMSRMTELRATLGKGRGGGGTSGGAGETPADKAAAGGDAAKGK